MPSKGRPQSRKQSDKRSDTQRRTDKARPKDKTVASKAAPGDLQNQPTPEEFGKRGMGMAAKE